jgi:hypothetical protein
MPCFAAEHIVCDSHGVPVTKPFRFIHRERLLHTENAMIRTEVVQRPEADHIQIKVKTTKPIDGDDAEAVRSLNGTRIAFIDRNERGEIAFHDAATPRVVVKSIIPVGV